MPAVGGPRLRAARHGAADRGGELAGACWPVPGQFTTLARQPAEDELGFDVATATAYRAACGAPMLEALQAARSFEDLLERLGAAGLSR